MSHSHNASSRGTRLAFGLPGEPDQGGSPFDGLVSPSFPNAVCATMDPDEWFPNAQFRHGRHAENPRNEREPKRLCATCPHELDCADYALANHIEFGIWGGLSEWDREVIWREQEAVA